MGEEQQKDVAEVLRVEKLIAGFQSSRRDVKILHEVDFVLNRGRIHGIVGESGCEKTVTNLSIVRLLPANGRITGGRILYRSRDVLQLPEREMRKIRGGSVALVFQEPSASFNPFLKIETQMIETIRMHTGLSKRGARDAAIDVLGTIGVGDPEKRIRDYPYQFSGGMLQRVLIAIAAVCEAEVILGDEPTSELDVTSQDRVLELLKNLSAEKSTSILLVTHDLGVAARTCDTISVMYAGRLVETAGIVDFFSQPKHPYSEGLLDTISKGAGKRSKGAAGIPGKPPDFGEIPAGCVFHPRCRYVREICKHTPPPEVTLSHRSVRCWLYSIV